MLFGQAVYIIIGIRGNFFPNLKKIIKRGKQKMKKILSILLTVALLFSVVPMAFSASAAENQTVVFDFGAKGNASHNDGKDLTVPTTYENGNYSLVITKATKAYGGAYDAKGNKIKEVYTGSNGSSSISEYTYDENGNITQYYDSWGDIWELYKITYDANGNAINIDYETSKGHKINCDLTYDADNNCVKIVMDSSDNVSEVYTAQYKLVYIPFEIDEDMYEDLLDIF